MPDTYSNLHKVLGWRELTSHPRSSVTLGGSLTSPCFQTRYHPSYIFRLQLQHKLEGHTGCVNTVNWDRGTLLDC